MKNILVVTSSFPTVSETFILNHITALIDKGFNVNVFSKKSGLVSFHHQKFIKYKLENRTFYQHSITKPTKYIFKILKIIGLLIENLPLLKINIFFKILKKNDIDLFFSAFYFLIHKMPDIIHIHFGHNAVLFCRLKAMGIIEHHVKLIVTFHGHDLIPNKVKTYKNKYQILDKEVDCFIVNTPYLLSVFKQVFTKKTVFVLPVWPDLKLFHSKPKQYKKNQPFEIVFCGRLINWKGPDLAIQIVKELLNKGNKVKLHLIGDGEMKHTLEKQVVSLQMEQNVVFYGASSQEKIKEVFEKSDLFLLPGRTEKNTLRAETQGLVIQEAQAMGLPVIVSDAGGMKYGLVDGKTGYVVKEDMLDEFVLKIELLIKNPKRFEKFSQSSIEFVKEEYPEKKVIQKIIDQVYKNKSLI